MKALRPHAFAVLERLINNSSADNADIVLEIDKLGNLLYRPKGQCDCGHPTCFGQFSFHELNAMLAHDEVCRGGGGAVLVGYKRLAPHRRSSAAARYHDDATQEAESCCEPSSSGLYEPRVLNPAPEVKVVREHWCFDDKLILIKNITPDMIQNGLSFGGTDRRCSAKGDAQL